MRERFLVLASALLILCGCDSEPRVFTELLVTHGHFVCQDGYQKETDTDFQFACVTLARLAKYLFVLTAAAREREVADSQSIREEPEDWLARQLRVTPIESYANGIILRTGISNEVPSADAVTIVNSVAAAFLRKWSKCGSVNSRSRSFDDVIRRFPPQTMNLLGRWTRSIEQMITPSQVAPRFHW